MSEITKPDFTYQWSSGGTLVTPSNVKIQTGWTAEVPPYQWENWSQNRQDNAIVHLFQKGISVWSATQDYYLTASGPRAYVQGSDGKVYEAVQTSTNQNPTTDTTNTYWKLAFRDQSGSALYALDTGTANTYKADFIPVVKTLVDGMVLRIKIVNANTTASTFTPANGVITAAAIVGGNHSALQGGEFIAGSDVWLQWNTTVGGGSWVVLAVSGGGLQVAPATKSQHAVQLAQMVGVVGGTRNGKMVIATASATGTYTADEVAVKSVLGGVSWLMTSFNKTINLATTGAGGMDTGSPPTSGYVAVYAIYNPVASTSALLAVNLSFATPATEVYSGASMPSGYTASALLTILPIASSIFSVSTTLGRKVYTAYRAIITGSTAPTSLTSTNIATAVPFNANKVDMLVAALSTLQPASLVLITSPTTASVGSGTYASTNSLASLGMSMFGQSGIFTPQTIFYQASCSSGTPTFNVGVTAYEF